MSAEWQEGVRRRLADWVDSGLGTGWVVAVSGGGDSVGLLRVLHRFGPELGLRLSVAHLDHGVRGEAGREDARFVAELAGTLDLPVDLGQWSPSRAGHFEADARGARYAWLAEVAQARGASVVAVGHTRDDQAETILHRIVRGTGPRGLAGIPSRRPLAAGITLARPFLKVAREEVRGLLGALGQPYRDDASNNDQSRTRARIRHDLLPKLAAEYNPKVAEALVRLGELAAASDRSDRRRVLEMVRVATIEANSAEVSLDRAALGRFSRFHRTEVLRFAWRRAGWPEASMSAERWRRLADLVRQADARSLVFGGIEILFAPETLVLRRRAGSVGTDCPPVPEVPVPLELPGSVPWGDGRVVTTLDPDAPRDETLDLDRLVAPLSVRAPLPGDRFQPLGMGEQTTPLNDFFRGRRVPREARGRIPLVCDRLGIVWVVGHRIAHRVRLTAPTGRTVGLRWEADAAGAGVVVERGCD
ncbi:tRNA lysidine(34) synthetase TilS [Singulisphaera acidiphila]|uniref:tRNA(Ile)-lysidine synthase n=1 Tax=Singulisphaera acidiphila (strain ATCC BAA-1392 / DSM 18658 / VKM B-2454 / MOB10) TaxID=886293 RepID=L0DR63_SINAD|nr:tRNA lysidine(34) synthetase TilS [Singulisphaera acidiphila]AGA31495.1 putative ATPase of the PP-loop superfamily implicated in cell cycle control [Singulisphaera acidiphila DSM 18658]